MATQKDIARHLNLSIRGVSDLLHKLDLPTRNCPIDDARIAYIQHLREVAAGRRGDGEHDLSAERARLTYHQANVESMKEQQQSGELIPADEVERAWIGQTLAARSILLALPARIAPVAMASTVRDAEEFARDEVYRALDELAGAEGDQKAG